MSEGGWQPPVDDKSFLHVGCGSIQQWQLKGFDSTDWSEIRFDIDPGACPDILGTLTDMSAVPSASVDAVYSAHNLEHVYPHEVPVVLAEFRRVLKDDGFVVLTCPDLVSVAAAVAQGRLLEPLYEVASGPIAAIDILYGHRDSLASGKVYMAHRTGFTYETLRDAFTGAEFPLHVGAARPEIFDLWIVAFKTGKALPEAERIARQYLP
jgi:SAM-dependent methyltransferase